MPPSPDEVRRAFDEAGRLQRAGELEAAAALWAKVADAAPAAPEPRVGLGQTLFRLDRVEEAEAHLREAVRLRPDAPWALRALATVLSFTGQWGEALTLLERAQPLEPHDPRLRLNLGYMRLGLGDFAGGWPLYEARAEVPDQNAAKPGLPNEWQGEDLTGRSILVWPEQGFGDQIQFARYIPALVERGAAVTLVTPPPLARLFAGLGAEVVELSPSTTLPAPDTWSLIGSLPGKLGSMDFRPTPYLAAQAGGAAWARGKTGVVWRGRATHPNDRDRSLPSAALLEPLRDAGLELVDLTEPAGDFADMAAIVAELDQVITVDTAVAHLAGALGKPVWILLPAFGQDWRWLQGRADSPWYPTARLFRQPRRGDWGAVVAEVTAALRD
jgi:hypothetical protein